MSTNLEESWTWEKLGFDSLTYAFNVIVERTIHCSDAAVLEAVFSRLWAVAQQLEGGQNHFVARGLHSEHGPLVPSGGCRGRLVV